jgi:hypothetical protein
VVRAAAGDQRAADRVMLGNKRQAITRKSTVTVSHAVAADTGQSHTRQLQRIELSCCPSAVAQ